MGFFDTVKKKAKEALTGESPGIQKYSGPGGRRIGTMGKYGGGAAGIDASTYKPDSKPSGHVGSFDTVGHIGGGYDAVTKTAHVPERKSGGLKGFGGKVVGGAGKALDWMAERGRDLDAPPKKRKGRAPRMSKEDSRLEDMYDPLMNERSAPRKKASGRAPRGSRPIGYDGSYDMFGVGNFGMGHEARESYAEEEREHTRRKKKGRRRAAPREKYDEGNAMDMNYIPPSMRGMF